MAQFNDSTGRTWEIKITIGLAKRVKLKTGINILDMFGATEANKLMSDLFTLVDVLWLLCEDQAVARKVSDEQFGESLVGDAIHDAGQAFVDAVADFFPSCQRKVAKLAIEKANARHQNKLNKAIDVLTNLSLD